MHVHKGVGRIGKGAAGLPMCKDAAAFKVRETLIVPTFLQLNSAGYNCESEAAFFQLTGRII